MVREAGLSAISTQTAAAVAKIRQAVSFARQRKASALTSSDLHQSDKCPKTA